MESNPAEITQLLQQWADGDGRALDQMMPLATANCAHWPKTRCGESTAATLCRPRRS